MTNRLKLDWTLSTAKERSAFIQEYINTDIFQKKPPNEEELETMGNYLLWGQDEDGFNPDQKKEIQLPRRNSTWATQNTSSLEELLENPNFSENSIHPLGASAAKKHRSNLSREELRKKLHPQDLETFETLWKEIDRVELEINFFELERGKRTKPPREELFRSFSEEEVSTLKARGQKLTQFQYLKLRHLLVELRRQQYPLKDAVLPGVFEKIDERPPSTPGEEASFEANVAVFPLGLEEDFLFKDFGELIPQNFGEEELWKISKFYWKKKEEEKRIQREAIFYFDFRDLEMVYQLILGLEEFRDAAEEQELSNAAKLLKTLLYYVRQAHLTIIQQKILELKIKKIKNQEIADTINSKFGKKYTANYISTIFRQKIVPAINEAASYHEKVVGSLFFEEEFKACSKCGKIMLRDTSNFVKKSRARDGLSSSCKRCDKRDRLRRKGV